MLLFTVFISGLLFSHHNGATFRNFTFSWKKNIFILWSWPMTLMPNLTLIGSRRITMPNYLDQGIKVIVFGSFWADTQTHNAQQTDCNSQTTAWSVTAILDRMSSRPVPSVLFHNHTLWINVPVLILLYYNSILLHTIVLTEYGDCVAWRWL